jgi:general secretion pathway protein G
MRWLFLQSIPFLKRIVCQQRLLSASEASAGFTLIELIVVVTITGILAAVAIPTYTGYIEKARQTKAIAELRLLETEILAFYAVNDRLPLTLDEIGRENLKDPWGNPYVFLNFETIKGQGKGKMRKDRFLVPINTDYDLCSMGPDGKTVPPLTAKASRDDIIRANNGAYIGRATEF